MKSTRGGGNTLQEKSAPSRFLNLTVLLWEIYSGKEKKSHTCMCVCISPPGRCSVSLPHPPGLKVLLAMPQRVWWFQFYSTEHNDSQTFLGKSRWKYATSYQHPSSGQCLTWKALWENEISPQKSIGDPYFLWLDMHSSAARIIISKLIDPNVMQIILEWEKPKSLNGLRIFCWLHSQMRQWPWWLTSNRVGQGIPLLAKGVAIIWGKVGLRKFFNFTFWPAC